MNAYFYFFFCILCVSSLEGSALVKKASTKVIPQLFAVSTEGRPFQLDQIWVHESEYIANKIQENSELGTEKMALQIPLGLEQLEELNSHLLKLKNGTKKQLKKDFMSSLADSDRSPTAFHSKVRELCHLFKAIKLMGLKKLQPIALAGFLFLLKKETVLNAFSANPRLIDELDLPSDVARSLVKLVSDEDQEFLRAQLCITAKSHKQPSSATVSPCGRYALTAGLQKKETSFFEVFDTMNGDSIRHVTIDGKIKGIHFCQDDHIIIWNKKRVDL
jgi:hypothetical protein